MDNVFIERLWRSLKHEDIYLKHYADGREARAGIARWFNFYNNRRPHQALGYRTPMRVWQDGMAETEEAVDMWTTRPCDGLDQLLAALPTGPQPQQHQAWTT